MASKKKSFCLADLAAIIEQRAREEAHGSYTQMLLGKGAAHICRKLQEEVLEVILESHDGNRERLTRELGDLFYHALVLAASHGVLLSDIEKCLGGHHKSVRTEEERALREMMAHEVKSPSLALATILAETNCAVTRSTDIVLFSPNVLGKRGGGSGGHRAFPAETKAVRTRFQGQDLKVKLGIGPKERASHGIRRRSQDLVLPIVYVVNAVVMPLCVGLLASYLKDIIDGAGPGKARILKKRKTRLSICVSDSAGKRERWFKFEGEMETVLEELAEVADAE